MYNGCCKDINIYRAVPVLPRQSTHECPPVVGENNSILQLLCILHRQPELHASFLRNTLIRPRLSLWLLFFFCSVSGWRHGLLRPCWGAWPCSQACIVHCTAPCICNIFTVLPRLLQRKESSLTDSLWYLFPSHKYYCYIHSECLRIRLQWKHSLRFLLRAAGIHIEVQLNKYKSKEAHGIGALISK